MSSLISAGCTFSAAPMNVSAKVSVSMTSSSNSLLRSCDTCTLSLAGCCVAVAWPPLPVSGASVPWYRTLGSWGLAPVLVRVRELTVSGCSRFGGSRRTPRHVVSAWGPLHLSVGSVILLLSLGGSWHPGLCLGLGLSLYRGPCSALGASQTRPALCLAHRLYYSFLVLIYFELFVACSHSI